MGVSSECVPLSLSLSVAIEPLLSKLRSGLSHVVYANDVNVFIQNQRDVIFLTYASDLYKKASSAKVNWGKKTRLCGLGTGWKQEQQS